MRKYIQAFLQAFEADESGATAIEYALIGSLIAVAVIASVMAINESMTDLFMHIRNAIVPALNGTS